MGQFDQAHVMASAIADQHAQAYALVAIAGALARAGQYQQAEALARTITNWFFQVRALTEIAGILARADQRQQASAAASQAASVACSITYPESRDIPALAEIPEMLARVGETRSAARVTAELCRIATWTRAVTPVLMLVPTASTTLIRTLEEL